MEQIRIEASGEMYRGREPRLALDWSLRVVRAQSQPIGTVPDSCVKVV